MQILDNDELRDRSHSTYRAAADKQNKDATKKKKKQSAEKLSKHAKRSAETQHLKY